jgi:hypothetical protein
MTEWANKVQTISRSYPFKGILEQEMLISSFKITFLYRANCSFKR